MKIWMNFLLLLISCTIIFGCSALVPEHPGKSKSDYYIDKKECERQARSFAYDSQQDFSIIDEMSNIRDCMRTKGWRYIKK